MSLHWTGRSTNDFGAGRPAVGRSSLSALVLVLCGACVAWASPLAAQSSEAAAQLTAIRAQLRQAGFREAASAITTVLARTDLSAAQRNEALELDAIVSLARRDEEHASAALRTLYERDPGHRLSDPDASPVVQGAFARAREAAHPRPIVLETTSAAFLGRNAPVVALRVAEGLDRISELRLNVRLVGAPRFTALVVPPEPDGRATATLPLGSDPGVQTFEVYVEALAPSGTAIGTLASEAAPLRIEVAAVEVVAPVVTQIVREETETPRGSDVTGEWWFWTLIGVAVVGAAVGVGVGVAASQPHSPDGSLGNIELPLIAF